jgi:hypothetical protein
VAEFGHFQHGWWILPTGEAVETTRDSAQMMVTMVVVVRVARTCVPATVAGTTVAGTITTVRVPTGVAVGSGPRRLLYVPSGMVAGRDRRFPNEILFRVPALGWRLSI